METEEGRVSHFRFVFVTYLILIIVLSLRSTRTLQHVSCTFLFGRPNDWTLLMVYVAAISGTFPEIHLSRTKLFTDLIRGYTAKASVRVRIERRLKMELPPKVRGEDGSDSEGDW